MSSPMDIFHHSRPLKANIDTKRADKTPKMNCELLSFDEIFLTTEPMRRYFRLLGLFPCFVPPDMERSVQYQFYWAKWQPVMAAHTLLISIYAIYSTFVDMIAFLTNDMEKYVMGALALELLTGVVINVTCLLVNATQWPTFYQRWTSVDYLLDIRLDKKLRRLSRLIFIGFTFYTGLLVSITIPTGILLIVLPNAVAIRPTYIVGIFTYCFHWSICLLLPEFFSLFLLLAINSRLKTISQQLAELFRQNFIDTNSRVVREGEITKDVERLRIVYQLLMDVISHIKQVLGPVLVTTCILHGLPLPLMVYSFVKQGQTDPTIKLLKIIAFITGFTRVAVMCFVAQKVSDQSKSVCGVLRDAPSNKLSTSSNDEIVFFMNCIRVSSSKISAWGFLDVDTGYLQSVVGVMIAYTITIMQFEMPTAADRRLFHANYSSCPHLNNDTTLSAFNLSNFH